MASATPPPAGTFDALDMLVTAMRHLNARRPDRHGHRGAGPVPEGA